MKSLTLPVIACSMGENNVVDEGRVKQPKSRPGSNHDREAPASDSAPQTTSSAPATGLSQHPQGLQEEVGQG